MAAEDLGLPLVTHAGGGEVTPGRRDSPGSYMIHSFEAMWLGRRGLPQMLCGGVFERHPDLRVMYTEQRLSWVGETLRDLDSCYFDPNRDRLRPSRSLPIGLLVAELLHRRGFIAPYEVALREQLARNIMWGSDYPHAEGTWPRTLLALRNSFADVPEGEVLVDVGGERRKRVRRRCRRAPTRRGSDRAYARSAVAAAGAGRVPQAPRLGFPRFGIFAGSAAWTPASRTHRAAAPPVPSPTSRRSSSNRRSSCRSRCVIASPRGCREDEVLHR